MDATLTIVTCILSSTVAAAVVTSIKEIVLWRLNRKAKLADDASEANDQNTELKKILDEHQKILESLASSVGALEKKLNLSLENDKIILKDKIKYLVLKYVEIGEITLDEKQAIQHMWNIYHYDLGGNGDLDDFMDMLENIPLVQHHNLRGVIQ